MALITRSRVMEVSTSTGTGDMTVSGAYTGFDTFASKCSVNDTFYGLIEALDALGFPSGDWETGLYTYSASNTITRTTVLESSNSDAAVNFSAGSKRISICPIALAPGVNGLINIQTFTSGSGTYTPTPGTRWVEVEGVGAGGGGGGIASPGSGNAAWGRGGGGGGYFRKKLTSGFSGGSYSVGGKGTGGTAGANNGSAGGDTTFQLSGGGTTYTASGGSGGNSTAAVATPGIAGGQSTGGTGTNGDDNMDGTCSTFAGAISMTGVQGGGGGSSRWGAGARGLSVVASNTTVNGLSASGGPGGGGGGGCGTGTGVARAGGDGADGKIIIREYH